MDLEFIQGKKKFLLAGVDEVGRGPLAGPVVGACATIKGDNERIASSFFEKLLEMGVTDSKKISEKKRRKIITKLGFDFENLPVNKELTLFDDKNCKITVSIAEISETKIDQINILNASLEAMKDSFENIYDKSMDLSGILLIDGNKTLKKSFENIEQVPVVKGDSKSVLIGVASIFAKEYRDQLMSRLGKKYPGYGLENHSGYPTAFHKEAISKLGVTPIHRKSFKGVKEFLQ